MLTKLGNKKYVFSKHTSFSSGKFYNILETGTKITKILYSLERL